MQAILHSFTMRPLVACILLSSQCGLAVAAVNLSIVPNGTLPTTVFKGGQVTANFTVTNKTAIAQNGFKVKGLPGTVAQNTSSGNCPQTINLAPAQQCNLALTISGEAKSSFALCYGSSCSTSSVPLNVSVLPSGPKLQFAAGAYVDTNSYFNLVLAKQNFTGTWTYPIDGTNNQATQPADIINSNVNRFLSVGCNADQSLCLAGGLYDSSTGYFPLIGMSTDAGETWTYPVSSSHAPGNINNSNTNNFINSVSCTGSFCIGAGNVTTTISGSFDNLIAQTTDLGSTWSFPTLPPAANQTSPGAAASLLGSTCLGTTCYAVGDYDTSGNSYFVVYQGAKSGSIVNWSVVLDNRNPFSTPSLYNGFGSLHSISCNAQVCIAGGKYGTIAGGQGFSPVIAQNTGTNQTWVYSVDSSSSIWPSDFQVLSDSTPTGFFSTSCSDNVCMAAGFYSTTSGGTIPVVAQSADNGATWSMGVTGTRYPAPDLNLTGDSSAFTSVSCSNTICIAGGSYITTNSAQGAMMLAQSTDQGATWTYPISINNQPADATARAFVYNVNCQNNVCTAAGTYENGASQLFLAETTDGGQTWTFQITSAGPLPANFDAGNFYSTYASSTLLPKWLRELL